MAANLLNFCRQTLQINKSSELPKLQNAAKSKGALSRHQRFNVKPRQALIAIAPQFTLRKHGANNNATSQRDNAHTDALKRIATVDGIETPVLHKITSHPNVQNSMYPETTSRPNASEATSSQKWHCYLGNGP